MQKLPQSQLLRQKFYSGMYNSPFDAYQQLHQPQFGRTILHSNFQDSCIITDKKHIQAPQIQRGSMTISQVIILKMINCTSNNVQNYSYLETAV